MSLELYYHPFASYCWKVLIALYENDTPFERHVVDLGDPAANAAFKKLWPMGKFPVVRDTDRGQTIPESSVIIEYLASYYPGTAGLVAANPELAWQERLWDRFYDSYVHAPMQKVVLDALRPLSQKDALGVEEARAQLRSAYAVIEQQMATRAWAVASSFSMADCSAAPALYYANFVVSLDAYENTNAYLRRLMERPSFARVLTEAEPYQALFPLKR